MIAGKAAPLGCRGRGGLSVNVWRFRNIFVPLHRIKILDIRYYEVRVFSEIYRTSFFCPFWYQKSTLRKRKRGF